jgi:hypothetical protein
LGAQQTQKIWNITRIFSPPTMFFGEHLLTLYPDKIVAIVESKNPP